MPRKFWNDCGLQLGFVLGVLTMVTTNGLADDQKRLGKQPPAMPAAVAMEVNKFAVEMYPTELRPRDGTVLCFNAMETMERRYVLYDLETGKEVKRFRQASNTGYTELSPDGRWMVGTDNRVLEEDGVSEGLRVWSTHDQIELRLTNQKHREEISGVAWLPDGKRLLSWAKDPNVCLWNAGTDGGKPRLLSCFANKQCGFTAVVPSPDGTRVAAAEGGGGRVAILDVSGDSIKLIRQLPRIADPHYRNVEDGWVEDVITKRRFPVRDFGMCFSALAYFPDGRRIVTAAEDGTLLVLDTETGEELARHHEAAGGRTMQAKVAVSPDGMRVLFAIGPAPACLWDWKNGRIVATIPSHARAEAGEHGGISTLAFSPDGRQALTGGADGTVRLWKLPE